MRSDTESKIRLVKSSFFMNPQFSKTVKTNTSLFPTACCRCENEIEAIMKNRMIRSSEGLGKRSPQRDGRRNGKLVFEFSYSIGVSCSRNAAHKSFGKIVVECLQLLPRRLGLVRMRKIAHQGKNGGYAYDRF